MLQLNGDLIKISSRAYQWKMSFNPNINKQAQQVLFFFRKSQRVAHPTVYFNSPVIRISSQKGLGIHLGKKLSFIHHINGNISKANRGVGVI